MRRNLIGPEYYSDLYYKSDSYRRKIANAERIERNRQDLLSGNPTAGALAYARFLSACEEDAADNTFRPNDTEVLRQWPFLKSIMIDNH